MVACHSAFNVSQKLLVAVHHLEIIVLEDEFVISLSDISSAEYSYQLEVDLNHLFKGFEPPLSLLLILKIDHFLERHQRFFRRIFLQSLAVVILVLKIDIGLRVAVL